MAFTKDWADSDELLPTDSEQIKLGPAKIRDTKVAIRERLQVDHEFGTAQSGTDTGFHKKVTIKKVSGGPSAPTAGYTELSYDSNDNLLKYYPEGGAKETLVEKDIAQTLTNKTLTSPVINNPTLTGAVANAIEDQGGVATSGLKCKVIEIGDWNIYDNAAKSVSHGLTASSIRSATLLIRNDAGNWIAPNFHSFNRGNMNFELFIENISATSVSLYCGNSIGSGFRTTDYNSTSYNRGWITIWYEA